ncbi:MAG TPA: PAS domain S-box protein, partial [Polyangiaceae bacterium]
MTRPPLHVLVVDDSVHDAEAVVEELGRDRARIEHERVASEAEFRAALARSHWDIVISDWTTAELNGLAALHMLQQLGLHTPFFIVSGSVGEDLAVEAMRAGARDFFRKDALGRLRAAVERELTEQREHEAAEAAVRGSERRLRRAEARFRAMIEKNADLISLMAADGTCVYVSPAIERVLGRKCDAHLGTNGFDVVHREDRERMAQVMAEMIADPGRPVTTEFRACHTDGSYRWLEATARNLLGDPEVAAIVGNFRDITDRKQAEATLRKTEEQLCQAQKMEAIGNLAGGVAHDFNNLLSVILSYSRLLAEDMTASDPRRADLEEIEKAGQRAVGLTGQLLAFGRKQILQPRILSLNDVIAGMEPMLKRLIGEDVELSVLPSAELGNSRVDAGQIEQIVMNL